MPDPGIADTNTGPDPWELYLDKCFNERQRVERAQFYAGISAGRALPPSPVPVTSRNNKL